MSPLRWRTLRRLRRLARRPREKSRRYTLGPSDWEAARVMHWAGRDWEDEYGALYVREVADRAARNTHPPNR